MKRKFILLIVLLLALLGSVTVAANEFDSQALLDSLYEDAPQEVTQYIDKDQLSADSILENVTTSDIIDFLSSQLLSTLKENIGVMISIVGILIFVGIYDTLRDSLSHNGTTQISDFFCAALVAIVACPPLVTRANELSLAISQLSEYMNLSLPIMTGLLAATGHTGAAGVLHFFIYLAATLAGNLFSKILLPLSGTYMCIGISASITDNSGMRNLTGSIRTLTTRCMVFFCTVFTALLSLQGVIHRAGDTLSRRTVKLAVGTFLPVVGNLLTESVDTFMSGVGVIRSVAGILGVLVVFYLIIIPIIKTFSNLLLIRLSAFIGDMIGTPRIRSLLNVVADGYGIILSISCGVGILFVICMAFLLIIGGAV